MKRLALDFLSLSLLVFFGGYSLLLFSAERAFQEGEKAAQNDRLPQALSAYMRAADLFPFRAEYHRAVGRTSMTLHQPGGRSFRKLYQALSAYERVVELDPQYPYGWFELGQVLVRFQKEGKPVRSPGPYLRRAVEIDPKNPKFLAGWLEWLWESGKREEAWPVFLALVRSAPETVVEFGPQLLAAAESRELFRREISNQPLALIEYARFLLGSGEAELAFRELSRIPGRERTKSDIAMLMAEILVQLGKKAEAEKTLAEARGRDPRNVSLLTRLARLKAEEGELRAAIVLYKQALSLHPDQWLLNMEIARLALRAGEDDEAFAYYTAALDSGYTNTPLKMEILLARAQIQERRGNLRAALGEYEKALEIDPADKKLARAVELLQTRIKLEEGSGP